MSWPAQDVEAMVEGLAEDICFETKSSGANAMAQGAVLAAADMLELIRCAIAHQDGPDFYPHCRTEALYRMTMRAEEMLRTVEKPRLRDPSPAAQKISSDADAIVGAYLGEHPEAAEAWARYRRAVSTIVDCVSGEPTSPECTEACEEMAKAEADLPAELRRRLNQK